MTTEYKEMLENRKNELVQRIANLTKDKTRSTGPLPMDFEEQAIAQENDEVVDGLDELERMEIIRIDSALERLESGTYGVCTNCTRPIEDKRLNLVPYTHLCINCSSD